MTEAVDIQYRDFYDIPRMFVVAHGGQHFLFDGSFSDDQDDYPEDYEVYLMPPLRDEQLAGSWTDLKRLALRSLGRLPTRSVVFDTTRRQSIDAHVLSEFSRRVA